MRAAPDPWGLGSRGEAKRERNEKRRKKGHKNVFCYSYIVNPCAFQSGLLMVCNGNAPWLFYVKGHLWKGYRSDNQLEAWKLQTLRAVWGPGLRITAGAVLSAGSVSTGTDSANDSIPLLSLYHSLRFKVSEENVDWSNEVTCSLPGCRRGGSGPSPSLVGGRDYSPPRPYSLGERNFLKKELGALECKPTC